MRRWGMTLLLLLVAGVVLAADNPILQDPLARKYLKMDGYGNVLGIINPVLGEIAPHAGNGLFGNPLWEAALAGNPDGRYAEVFRDLTTFSRWNGKLVWPLDRGSLFNRVIARQVEVGSLGLVLWKVADARARLVNMIDNYEKLNLIACGAKEEIYNALWFLGDESAADVMIEGMNNDDYTVNHINRTLCVWHNWNLSSAQKDRIAALSLKVFQNKASKRGKDREKAPACMRYLGMALVNNSDAVEFLKNALGKSGPEKIEAIRALGRLNAAGVGAQFQDILNKMAKKTRNVVTGYHARPETVAAAIALANAGDALGTSAVKAWIMPDQRGNYDKSAFESAFYEIGFLNDAGRAALQDALVAAFNAATGAGLDKGILVRAATGLLQMGNNAGLATVTAALAGNDNGQIEDALNGIGGYQNYFLPRSGTGGIKGGTGGIVRAEVDALANTILARMKFWSGNMRTKGGMAILDMRARTR